ncbi:MAG TPA: SDR family NAD(P)-dependent oxidoreductase, partial [Acidimicrobiia bacterium]|nr:SDR family NAD(P)-dependent oxidoreductase [Acidimicrobiia bacterium]
MREPFRLDGNVALVTGASSGLGARFATVLCDAGVHVIATARRTDRLDTLRTTSTSYQDDSRRYHRRRAS